MAKPPVQLLEVGYRGHPPHHISERVREIEGAILVDVRFGIMPANQSHSQAVYQRLLDDRFVHVRAFGNRNYRHYDQPIELADPDQGIRELSELRNRGALAFALMCACERYSECHRRHVAILLERVWGVEQPKTLFPTLFDQ